MFQVFSETKTLMTIIIRMIRSDGVKECGSEREMKGIIYKFFIKCILYFFKKKYIYIYIYIYIIIIYIYYIQLLLKIHNNYIKVITSLILCYSFNNT